MISKNAALPVLPVRNIVVFPKTFLPIVVARKFSINAIMNASTYEIIVVSQQDGNVDNPSANELYSIGVLCKVLQIIKLPDENYRISLEALHRVSIEEYLDNEEFFEARYEEVQSINSEKDKKKYEAYFNGLINSFREYSLSESRCSAELIDSLDMSAYDHEKTVNLIAANLQLKIHLKQQILEEVDIYKQIHTLLEHIATQKYIIDLERRILSGFKTNVEKNTRIHTNIDTMQKELDDDDFTTLENKLKNLELPNEVREKVNAELKRLKSMNPMSGEALVSRLYLECLSDLPWAKFNELNKDLRKAKEVLGSRYYGLDKIKERVYQFIALQNRIENSRGSVLCFFGPPGVGKTSLAKLIAEATGREFINIPLGGVKDEAELRGHRRTYVGSMPGKIIQALKTVKSSNPLILLDEIGNLGSDYRGDPQGALLEILDPAQNHSFRDHYLDAPFDLSKVLFIATTNVLNFQRALLDRFEVLELSGYTLKDKMIIAEQCLIPDQLEYHKLLPEEFEIDHACLETLITVYTRPETGVRGLIESIKKICGKVLLKIEEARMEDKKLDKIIISSNNLSEFLPQKYKDMAKNDESDVGIVTGMAWTEVGGALLNIEVVVNIGKGDTVITGNLGKVMEESVKMAAGLIMHSHKEYGINIEENFFTTHSLHVHVPEGAIPKDGPSAGVTILTAMFSAVSGKKVSNNVAMTGELTLTGKVLKIGGVKEKVLAVHRAGITNVLLPEDNRYDYENDISEDVKNTLQVHFCKNIRDVLKVAILHD